MNRSRSDRSFDVLNALLLLIIALVTLYPLYYIIIASVSDPYKVSMGHISILPVGFQLSAYKEVLANQTIWTGYKNTILYTLVGGSYNLVLTISAAYVVSKKRLPGRSILMWFFFITMYFSGGMIPTYLNLKRMGMLNTPWVLMIGSGVSCWYLIVTRQYFVNSIPEELYEAAEIDGASEMFMFRSIALPLSLPIIAVIALYYAVGKWNDYYSAMLYINEPQYFPLQLVLRNILLSNQMALANIGTVDASMEEIASMAQRAYLVNSMKYAVIFIASAPLLAAFPFVQKYFVKGVQVGAIKG